MRVTPASGSMAGCEGVGVAVGRRVWLGVRVTVAVAVAEGIEAMIADVVALTPEMVCVAISTRATRIAAYPLDARACPDSPER